MPKPLQVRRRPKVDDSHLPATLHPLLRQIFASRGVDDPALLERSASQLLPPQRLYGMEQAVPLLADALIAQKRILIVGDFDCDGATSSALCVLALRAMGGHHIDFLVPNRFEFGYGLTPEIVALAVARGAEFLITVDNGISSIAGVAAAKAAGMQVLVTDHHLPGQELPDADAIVNPNQHGCDFPSKSLAGVGVAFYLMAALNTHLRQLGWYERQGLRAPNVADYLDLVALGTVADVVALDGNNRILVHQGLQRIRAGRCRPGIQALVDVSGRDGRRLTAADLGFALGPRLNAVGRLDDMSLGVACLLSDDLNLARQLAAEMDSLNQERKEIEQGMQQEALATLEQIRFRDGEVPSGIVLHRNEWHQGVVGLVASKVKEKYYRPVIAFAESSESELKGSGRSIPGVHLRDALELLDTRHPGLMGKFGGHAMAAGLTLAKANIEAFGRAFEAVICELVTPELLTGVLLTDGELLPDELNLELAELIRASGPWGQAFPEPLFDGEFVLVQQRLVGEKHLKLMLTTDSGYAVDAIAFGVDLKRWPDASVKRVRLVYRLDVNEWRGNRSVQLLVEHLEAAVLFEEKTALCENHSNSRDRSNLITRFKLLVHESTGQQYEKLFVKIMSYSDPSFQPVKAHGSIGDRGNDGWSKSKGIYYQVYAPEELYKKSTESIKKMHGDFDNLKIYWNKISPVKEFYFVVNDKYNGVSPHINKEIANIKIKNSLEKTDLILAKDLENILFSLSDSIVRSIVGSPLDSEKNIYAHLVNEITTKMYLPYWPVISENLIANGIENDVIDGFNKIALLIFKTDMPNEIPSLEQSIIELSDRAIALAEHFTESSYTFITDNNKWWFKDMRWKKTRLPQSDYDNKYAEYDNWSKQLFCLHTNLVYALNKFSKEVRTHVDVNYFMRQKFTIVDSIGTTNNLEGYEAIPTKYI